SHRRTGHPQPAGRSGPGGARRTALAPERLHRPAAAGLAGAAAVALGTPPRPLRQDPVRAAGVPAADQPARAGPCLAAAGPAATRPGPVVDLCPRRAAGGLAVPPRRAPARRRCGLMALFPLKRVDALVAGSIATHIGAVLAVLVGFDVLQALYKEFMDIGDGDYTALGAIVHVAYTVPRRIHTLFIIAAVIGTLMGLGMLAGNGELTGLRAAGLSKRRIALSATGAVGGLALAVFLMGETLAPEGERWAQTMAVQAKHRDYAV